MSEKTVQDFTGRELPTWCPGCGGYGMMAGLRKALAEINASQKDTVIVSGIGCGSKTPRYFPTYAVESLHGRALPVATGIKLANHKLNVVVTVGDGDCYGIGGNHLIHAMRRNLNLTVLVQNNSVYGLTRGQTSPTSAKGFVSGSTPHGALEEPINPIAQAIIGGSTYVARSYANDPAHLNEMIANAIKHKGFALIDVFQPCVTYNKVNTAQWYKENIYKINQEEHDSGDKIKALEKALEWGPKSIPIGLFYKSKLPLYEDGLPQIKDKALVHQSIDKIDLSQALEKYG